MTDELLQVIAQTALAAAALLMVYFAYDNYSTPGVCKAAEVALRNPGSELVVYGKVKAWQEGTYVLLSCGLKINKSRVSIEKTMGRLVIGSTASGQLYIR
ncbi:MAG: hypothetical protein ABWK05_08460 [Pyrobaculum sp.]